VNPVENIKNHWENQQKQNNQRGQCRNHQKPFWKTKQNKNTGNIDVSTRWVPEFALEELPQLTQKELEKLANVQRASAGLD